MIEGPTSDSYYENLPEHDLGGLSNYFYRISRKREMRSCLDVGANIGLSALLLSEIAPLAQIHAFEPSPNTFEYLRKNIDTNLGAQAISLYKSAVGRENGQTQFVEDANTGASSHIAANGVGLEVPIIMIDSFVENSNFDAVDFIKIDVEGFETDVLSGARYTIFRFRPIVFLEFNEYAIKTHAKRDPAACLQAWLELLGPLGVVNPLNGDSTLLPADPHEALSAINELTHSEFGVVDLVTHASDT